ncbi:MAG: molybdopterin-dependent oxidoreductase [Gemmatimonadota bacterium]
MSAPNPSGATETKLGTCYFCTSKGCGVRLQVADGRIQKVSVDQDCPVVPGAFCGRPYLAKEYQEHPFRLQFPLKRAGERGANQWEPISWDQALDEIAARLAAIRKQHGAEAVATSSGTGRGAADFAKTRFMNLFGSPNRFGAVTICYGPRSLVGYATFGGALVPDRQPGKTRMMVLWGRNPHEGGPSTWHSFQQAKAAGLRTMVVDPRHTEPSRQADRWVQLAPGTDAALALGIMHVIVREGLFDRDFVERATHGFEALRQRLEEYPPERVAAITGLSVPQLEETARFYAAHQPSTMVIGVAAEHSAPNSIQAIRAINLLRALVGSVDVAGGELIGGPYPGFVTDAGMEANEALPAAQRRKQLGADRFRFLSYPGWELVVEQLRKKWGEQHPGAAYLNCMAHAPTAFRAMLTGEPYPVKALLVSASNPLLSYGNTRLVYEALKAAELLVTFDLTWTPTAVLSDYVLPAASWLERPDMGNFASVGAYPLVQVGEAALPASVPGQYDRLDDYQFWRQLGLRLGQESDWPWETFEAVWEYRLGGLMQQRGQRTLREFVHDRRWAAERPEPGSAWRGELATTTGKVELYSTVLEKLGYDPLPAYLEPRIPTEIQQKYRFINLSGCRFRPYHHSEFRHVDAFRRQFPEPVADIHVDVALRMGIAAGDWIYIETPRGRIKQRARLCTDFDPRYIVTQHGWWFPEQEAAEPSLFGVWQSNINVVTDDDPDLCDPLSGGWPYKGQYMRCRIYKA